MKENKKSLNLYIIAGPNGSEKTTFVRKFLPDYAKCLNLFHLYRPLLDSWILFDNSEDTPVVIAREKSGILTVIDNNLFEKVKKGLEVL